MDPENTYRVVGHPGDRVIVTPKHDPNAYYDGVLQDVVVGRNGIEGVLLITEAETRQLPGPKIVLIPWHAIEAVSRPVPTEETPS